MSCCHRLYGVDPPSACEGLAPSKAEKASVPLLECFACMAVKPSFDFLMDDAASRRTSSAASIGQHGAHSECSLQHLCYMISPLFASSRTALGRSFLPTSTLCWTFRVFRSGQKQGGIRGRTRGCFHEAGRGIGALLDITGWCFFFRSFNTHFSGKCCKLKK